MHVCVCVCVCVSVCVCVREREKEREGETIYTKNSTPARTPGRGTGECKHQGTFNSEFLPPVSAEVSACFQKVLIFGIPSTIAG